VNGRWTARDLARTIGLYVLPPLAAFAVLIAAWELYVNWRDISIIVVPPPSAVVERFFEKPGFFWEEGLYTLYEASLGLFFGSAVAIALAVVMAHWRLAERAIFPVAILLKVTPLVAVSPVLIIIFGFGTTPKIIVAALLSFFPMLVNAMTGFRDVNRGALEFLHSVHASPWHIFWKLRLPGSLPYLLTALKITYPLALVGAVVAEWFTGDRGLGVVIFRANYNLDTPTLFAAIGVLAVTGVIVNVAVSVLEQRLLFWHDTVRNTR
jgi:NitT/TauT family transport system permease protein